MDKIISRERHSKRWFLREWRLFKKLTQDSLAEKMGTGKPTICKLERYQLFGPGKGRQRLNDEWLDKYCCALDVTAHELATMPDSGPTIDDLLSRASPADQRRFRDMAEAFVKSAK